MFEIYSRGQGIGSILMNVLSEVCIQTRIGIYLIPGEPGFDNSDTDPKRRRNFYHSFGFKRCKDSEFWCNQVEETGNIKLGSLEEIDWSTSRNLDKNELLQLSDCSFIKRAENILITGPTGVGKSFIASAIGHQACHLGYKVIYFNMQKLFQKLRVAKAEGVYIKEMLRIEKQDLLILDDFRIHPMDANTRLELLEIIEDRHGQRSTMISSQLPVAKWYEIFEDGTIADALMDRLLHHTIRIDMKGESLRKKR